ncbi:MAG TPA: hypothetical protein PLC19_00155 [Marmoricola sp.]|jgi:hypothetical protein|nr:hypothetical protein [Marmoricola sp.]
MSTAKGLKIENYFMNWTKSCVIGLGEEYQRDYHRDKLKGKPVYERETLWPNGEWCFIPPGAVWHDSGNLASVLANGRAKDFFVHCENEDEFKIIAEAVPHAIERDDKGEFKLVRDENGKLKGWYGFFSVMRDVSRQHKEIQAKAVHMLAAEGHVQELSKKAKERDAAVDEAAKLKVESELLKKQIEDLKREVNAEKAMAALKKGK